MDGYPRSKADAQEVFMDKIPIASEVPQNEDEGEEAEPKFEQKLNEKVIPQYAVCIEGDDAFLTERAKQL